MSKTSPKLVCIFAVIAAVFGSLSVAKAEMRRVVVLPFDGRSSDEVQESVERMLSRDTVVLRQARYLDMAEDLNASLLNPENIRTVCREIRCDGIVDGSLDREGRGYTFVIRIRSGVDGQIVKRIAMRLKRPRIPLWLSNGLRDRILRATDDLDTISDSVREAARKPLRELRRSEFDTEPDSAPQQTSSAAVPSFMKEDAATSSIKANNTFAEKSLSPTDAFKAGASAEKYRFRLAVLLGVAFPISAEGIQSDLPLYRGDLLGLVSRKIGDRWGIGARGRFRFSYRQSDSAEGVSTQSEQQQFDVRGNIYVTPHPVFRMQLGLGYTLANSQSANPDGIVAFGSAGGGYAEGQLILKPSDWFTLRSVNVFQYSKIVDEKGARFSPTFVSVARADLIAWRHIGVFGLGQAVLRDNVSSYLGSAGLIAIF